MNLHHQIAKISLDAVPLEACGVIHEGKAIACKNTSGNPDTSFVISAEDFIKYSPSIIFHSHPRGVAGFSEHDLAVAANMDLVSYVYVVEADRLERWSLTDGLEIFENVLRRP